MIEKRNSYQILVVKKWLDARPNRFKTKRLRKKVFKNPMFYLKFSGEMAILELYFGEDGFLAFAKNNVLEIGR